MRCEFCMIGIVQYGLILRSSTRLHTFAFFLLLNVLPRVARCRVHVCSPSRGAVVVASVTSTALCTHRAADFGLGKHLSVRQMDCIVVYLYVICLFFFLVMSFEEHKFLLLTSVKANLSIKIFVSCFLCSKKSLPAPNKWIYIDDVLCSIICVRASRETALALPHKDIEQVQCSTLSSPGTRKNMKRVSTSQSRDALLAVYLRAMKLYIHTQLYTSGHSSFIRAKKILEAPVMSCSSYANHWQPQK